MRRDFVEGTLSGWHHPHLGDQGANQWVNLACQIEEAEHKSVAPGDTKLENFSSRMAWIKSAAGQFDKLMKKKAPYMETQLRTMAGWANLPDQ